MPAWFLCYAMKKSTRTSPGGSAIDYSRENMRWNGWGSLDRDYSEKEKLAPFLDFMAERLGMSNGVRSPSVALEELSLPPSRFKRAALNALGSIAGKENVTTDPRERVLHSVGRSYIDLVRLRGAMIRDYVDAVVYPRNEKQIQRLLEWCSKNRAAVIPFGGGSSVVGGVNAPEKRKGPTLSLDTHHMNRLLEIDPYSRLADFEPGLYGPQAEALLNAKGYTLGHFPQSFQYSTLGGWAASRGAGQFSDRYGKIEDIITSLRMTTPVGIVETERSPANALGPDIKEILTGSEGVFGVITRITAKIRPLPEKELFFGAIFPDFISGSDFLRDLSQNGPPVAMARLSDADETAFLMEASRLSGKNNSLKRVVHALEDGALRLLGFGPDASLLIIGLQGDTNEIKRGEILMRSLIRRYNGQYLGRKIGAKWLKDRYDAPFLRDHMLERGIAAETLETSVSHDRALSLHQAVREALKIADPSCLTGCHISHIYPDGLCLYFTLIYEIDPDRPEAQWKMLKTRATEAVLNGGGSLSHHHGVGLYHRPWFQKKAGAPVINALRSLKREWDPRGIMNPGKILDP